MSKLCRGVSRPGLSDPRAKLCFKVCASFKNPDNENVTQVRRYWRKAAEERRETRVRAPRTQQKRRPRATSTHPPVRGWLQEAVRDGQLGRMAAFADASCRPNTWYATRAAPSFVAFPGSKSRAARPGALACTLTDLVSLVPGIAERDATADFSIDVRSPE